MKQNEVIPMVAQAEAESGLPGFERFAEDVKADVKSARKNSAVGRLVALEVARKIFLFSTDGTLQARVDALNIEAQAKRVASGGSAGGSPAKASTYVKDALALECGVTTRTLDNWMKDWREVAGLFNLSLTCTAADFEAVRMAQTKDDQGDSLETFFDAVDVMLSTGTPPAPPRLLAPEVEGERFAKTGLKPFFEEDGKTYKANPVAFSAWWKLVQPVVKLHGVDVIVKQGKK